MGMTVCVSCFSHLVEQVVCGCVCISIVEPGAVVSSFHRSRRSMECRTMSVACSRSCISIPRVEGGPA
jgi:hypothetical protein